MRSNYTGEGIEQNLPVSINGSIINKETIQGDNSEDRKSKKKRSGLTEVSINNKIEELEERI